ncbi:hypothetical protein [Williamsia sterculiae]|nr:hypothetical protein [Williamsia sterculiae]
MTGATDNSYTPIVFVRQSLHNVLQSQTFVVDAERDGDAEAVDHFTRAQHNNIRAAETGKRLLQTRLGGAGSS